MKTMKAKNSQNNLKANQKNPNKGTKGINSDFQAAQNLRSRQLNPNNRLFAGKK